jgi:hypothetical protein
MATEAQPLLSTTPRFYDWAEIVLKVSDQLSAGEEITVIGFGFDTRTNRISRKSYLAVCAPRQTINVDDLLKTLKSTNGPIAPWLFEAFRDDCDHLLLIPLRGDRSDRTVFDALCFIFTQPINEASRIVFDRMIRIALASCRMEGDGFWINPEEINRLLGVGATEENKETVQ